MWVHISGLWGFITVCDFYVMILLPPKNMQWVFSVAFYLPTLKMKLLLCLRHVIDLLCLDKIFTLISISGYGDVSCQTVLGKMFLVLFLLVGLVGAQSSNTFYTLVIAQKLGLRPYYTFIAG